MNRSGKKVFLLVVYIGASILGLYMTFFYKNDADDNLTNISQVMESEINEEQIIVGTDIDMSTESQELPDYENLSDAETYTDGISTEVYFANTEVIDNGKLPMSVHSILTTAVSKYLKRSNYKDVTELYINEESYKETEEKITFNCFMDGYQEQLQVIYEISEGRLLFAIE